MDEGDGTVNCSTQVSKRDKNSQQEEIHDWDLNFHLNGSEWKYGPLDNVEDSIKIDNTPCKYALVM